MTPNERALGLRWLQLHSHEYDLICWQHALTRPPVHFFQMGSTVVAWPLVSWCLRPDFMAWSRGLITIGEVKRTLTVQVAAQLQRYQRVFMEDNRDAKIPKLFAIGSSVEPAAVDVFSRVGILYDVYPDVRLIPNT